MQEARVARSHGEKTRAAEKQKGISLPRRKGKRERKTKGQREEEKR